MIQKTILVTGGAGFIGSNLVRLLVTKYPDYNVVNLDALTYAGNLENVADLEDRTNYSFVKADITDLEAMRKIFAVYPIDTVIHLAAESHVDRSIEDPLIFVKTNILGTATLLQAAKEAWKESFAGKLFYHVSTDEVYGSLGRDRFLHRGNALRSAESVFLLEGRQRPPGPRLAPYLTACRWY